MSDPSREHAERVELRGKVNPELGSERAIAYPRESAFAARPLELGRHIVDSSFASAEPLSKRSAQTSAVGRAVNSRPDGSARASEFYPAHVVHPRAVHEQVHANAKKPLHVMKFAERRLVMRRASKESLISFALLPAKVTSWWSFLR